MRGASSLRDRDACADRRQIRCGWPAGDEDEIRATRRAARGGRDVGRGIDDGEIRVRVAGCGEYPREPLFGGSGEDRGVRGSEVMPRCGRSLRIEIDEYRRQSGPDGSDREGARERCLPRPALLADKRDREHRGMIPLEDRDCYMASNAAIGMGSEALRTACPSPLQSSRGEGRRVDDDRFRGDFARTPRRRRRSVASRIYGGK